MAWTSGLGVSVGDATKATHYNELEVNQDYIRDLADIDHDIDVSTGTGRHNDTISLGNAAGDKAIVLYETGSSDPRIGWDNTNQEVYLSPDAGTTKPVRADVDAPANSLYVDGDGDVGFGTGSPAAKQHVDEDTNAAPLKVEGIQAHYAREKTYSSTGSEDFFTVQAWDGTMGGFITVVSAASGNANVRTYHFLSTYDGITVTELGSRVRSSGSSTLSITGTNTDTKTFSVTTSGYSGSHNVTVTVWIGARHQPVNITDS
jgi:hypothetical protein